MLLGHSEHRKGKELPHNKYTPCKGSSRSSYTLVFLPEKALNWGAWGVEGEKTLRVCSPGPQNASHLLLGQAVGRPLPCTLASAGPGVHGGVLPWGTRWRLMLVPAVGCEVSFSLPHYHYSVHSTLRPCEVNPQQRHLGWKPKQSFSPLMAQGAHRRPVCMWDRSCSEQRSYFTH